MAADETAYIPPTEADLGLIKRILPHRYPFLLVDRIVDIDGERSAVGIKNVTASEPHFEGHFPKRPIMPGVLMIEGMAQTAAAVGIKAFNSDEQALVFFMTIDNAKFRRPVVPGDTVHIHVTKLKQRGTISKYACVAEVDVVKVAEAEVAAKIASADEAG